MPLEIFCVYVLYDLFAVRYVSHMSIISYNINRITSITLFLDNCLAGDVVQRATMKVDDRFVHVIDGNIILNGDGGVSAQEGGEGALHHVTCR